MTDLFTASTLPPTGATTAASRSRSGNGRDRKAARRRKLRRQVRTLLVLVITLAAVAGAGWFVFRETDLFGFVSPLESKDFPGPGGEQVQVEIAPGAPGEAMGQALYDAGVVASVGAFVEAYEANPNAQLIQAGTHVMLTEMRAADAVALLAKNEKVELKLTIPEGYTVAQVVDRAVEVTGLDRAAFDAALADPASIGLPAEAGGKAEGWLAPSTYYVVPNDTPASLLSQMVQQTVGSLTQRGVPQDQWQAVLTKASLVEREAKFPQDRPKMARAIENRLERGMTLDIDASTAYGLGKPGTELTYEDNHDANNPYALYVHLGLPPTPIANPGSSALDAVLNPEPGDWVFWVAVNLDTGETKFAETIQQHNKNVEELRAWQAANGG
ncbi:endolytic transglycosylase MltG [Antribacter gilvus]|uniref:endolytic transglycosylase MltG n=1 Tax=Antribacter gilvus TaxID=2304675 RepID=UPI001F0C7619|nr:endolytic transglycosylase MltG [Antribacter gilvus]